MSMRNLDAIRAEREAREARLAQREKKRKADVETPPQQTDPEGQKTPSDTQPEENGGGDRMFTQEEVNRIIAERLARERAKLTQEPTAEDLKLQKIEARENRIKCRDYLDEEGLPSGLLEVFDAEDYDIFVDGVTRLLDFASESGILARLEESGGQKEEANTEDSWFRKMFGLERKE